MSVIVPKDFDVTVQFPDGSTGKLNLFQMGTMAQMVRFRADHGVWHPSVAKLRLTRASIAERFYIAPEWAKTYSMLADTLAECHESMMAEYRAAVSAP